MISADIAKKRVAVALEELINLNHFGSVEAEKIEKEFKEFVENANIIKKLEKFDSTKERLDIFLISLCKEKNSSNNFIEFIKKLLILYPGNAAVERSFSFNKEFLVENLEENSLIAQRAAHDFQIDQIELMCFICDTPARAFVKCTKGHTGYYACEGCVITGVRFMGRTIYPLLNCEMRSDASFRKMENADHHKQETPLLAVQSLDLTKDIVIDSMHLILLGETKKLLDWSKRH